MLDIDKTTIKDINLLLYALRNVIVNYNFTYFKVLHSDSLREEDLKHANNN